MTDSRYGITLVYTNVPEELEGVPVSLEIVSAAGKAQRVVATPSEGTSWRAPVAGPGRYFVRGELPSGQWIGETANVEEISEGQPEAEVTLDFGFEKAPVVVAYESVFRSGSVLESHALSVPSLSTKNLAGRFAAVAPAVEDSPLSLQYGFFQAWLADPPEAGAPPTDRLAVQWLGPGSTSLPGRFTLPEHPGANPRTTLWRPLLVQLSSAGLEYTLLVWPPSPGEQTLDLVLDTDTSANPNVPPVLAFWTSGDRQADALFSYVRGEALQAARESAPEPVALAERFIDLKRENPLHATLAAYTLLKIGHRELDIWMSNLGNWFPYLPDGAIILGWFLIRAGQAGQARDVLHTALERGLPMYSEGVRLLRDGLGFLRGLYPDDSQIQADAARADRIASVANLDSELTCLRLGRGLALV